jgi:quercetin dioxygenase-like cupin family protein
MCAEDRAISRATGCLLASGSGFEETLVRCTQPFLTEATMEFLCIRARAFFFRGRLHFLLGLAVSLSAVGVFAEEMSQPVEIKEIARSQITANGQPVQLPGQGAEVIASVYTIAPGAKLPVHEHPYARYGYVLSGVLEVVEAGTGRTFRYEPGDFIIEVTGWHRGSNPGDVPVQLLVIDQSEPGETNTILKPQ